MIIVTTISQHSGFRMAEWTRGAVAAYVTLRVASLRVAATTTIVGRMPPMARRRYVTVAGTGTKGGRVIVVRIQAFGRGRHWTGPIRELDGCAGRRSSGLGDVMLTILNCVLLTLMMLLLVMLLQRRTSVSGSTVV